MAPGACQAPAVQDTAGEGEITVVATMSILGEDLLKTLSASDTAGEQLTREELAGRVDAPPALVVRRLRALARRGVVRVSVEPGRS